LLDTARRQLPERCDSLPDLSRPWAAGPSVMNGDAWREKRIDFGIGPAEPLE